MPQLVKTKTGNIKVSFHAAVLDGTYDYIKAIAERNKCSMGVIIDIWAKYHKRQDEVIK